MGVDGEFDFSVSAASSPFMMGMDKSSTIRSGTNSSALSMASMPFTASPTTLNPGSASNKARTAMRTLSESSTIRTVGMGLIDTSSSQPSENGGKTSSYTS